MSRKRKPMVTLPATVEKIIPSPFSGVAEKAEIAVEGADPLYRKFALKTDFKTRRGRKSD